MEKKLVLGPPPHPTLPPPLSDYFNAHPPGTRPSKDYQIVCFCVYLCVYVCDLKARVEDSCDPRASPPNPLFFLKNRAFTLIFPSSVKHVHRCLLTGYQPVCSIVSVHSGRGGGRAGDCDSRGGRAGESGWDGRGGGDDHEILMRRIDAFDGLCSH